MEKEYLAVKLGIQAFRVHILGRTFSHDIPLSTGVDEQNEGGQFKIDSVEFKFTTPQVHSEV